MTSALPLHPSSSAFSFNPSFLSSSYPPQPSSTAPYAGLSPGGASFSFHPNSNPFFAASPPSSSAFVGGGWDPHPLSTSSSSPFATSTLNSLQLGNGNEYLYTNNDAQSMSDTQSISDEEGGGGGGAASREQQGGGGGPRTSSSTTNVVEPQAQAQAQQKKPAANKRKKSPTKKKVSASGSDDDEDEGDHEGGSGGGKRRGSGGGGSELGSGDGGGRGTTLAEVLAEQGLTQDIYNGLPSAKKRQLRNKVSARAFRARRKDYIETLEGELAQKDGKVEAQRAEIARLKNENQLLRTRLRHSNNDH